MLRQHSGPTIKRKDGGINKPQQREGTHSQDSGKCICKSMERRAKITTLLPNKTLRENTECGVSVSRSFPVKELLGQGFHRSGNFKTCFSSTSCLSTDDQRRCPVVVMWRRSQWCSCIIPTHFLSFTVMVGCWSNVAAMFYLGIAEEVFGWLTSRAAVRAFC